MWEAHWYHCSLYLGLTKIYFFGPSWEPNFHIPNKFWLKFSKWLKFRCSNWNRTCSTLVENGQNMQLIRTCSVGVPIVVCKASKSIMKIFLGGVVRLFRSQVSILILLNSHCPTVNNLLSPIRCCRGLTIWLTDLSCSLATCSCCT